MSKNLKTTLVLFFTMTIAALTSSFISFAGRALGVPIIISFVLSVLSGWLIGYVGGRVLNKLERDND
jgi:NhaP-type Na+/H+ or K+/H+ antiporter